MRDEEMFDRLVRLEEHALRVEQLLDEFLPLVRAYLDPDQAGPRGYFMRRRLAATNGAHDG